MQTSQDLIYKKFLKKKNREFDKVNQFTLKFVEWALFTRLHSWDPAGYRGGTYPTRYLCKPKPKNFCFFEVMVHNHLRVRVARLRKFCKVPLAANSTTLNKKMQDCRLLEARLSTHMTSGSVLLLSRLAISAHGPARGHPILPSHRLRQAYGRMRDKRLCAFCDSLRQCQDFRFHG